MNHGSDNVLISNGSPTAFEEGHRLNFLLYRGRQVATERMMMVE